MRTLTLVAVLLMVTLAGAADSKKVLGVWNGITVTASVPESDSVAVAERPHFPNKVKIGPYTYSVKYADERDSEGGNWNGIIFPDLLEIEIRKDLPLAREREVVLHELIHGSVDVAYRGKTDCLSDETWLAAEVPTLLQILRENPELATYLLGK